MIASPFFLLYPGISPPVNANLAGISATPDEMRRIAWYDLFLYLTMVTESFYREYEEIESAIAWLRPQVADTWTSLCS